MDNRDAIEQMNMRNFIQGEISALTWVLSCRSLSVQDCKHIKGRIDMLKAESAKDRIVPNQEVYKQTINDFYQGTINPKGAR